MFRPAGTRPDPGVLAGCIREHRRGAERLKKLKRYYAGEPDIFRKTRDNPLARNNIVAAPNAFYITTVANGFTFANPLIYRGDNIDNLLAELKLAKSESHDAELGENLSIYGRGYELVYMSGEPSPHVKLQNLPPEGAFVVYSSEIDPEPMFAVYYFPVAGADGRREGWRLNVYDRTGLTVYRADSGLTSFRPEEGERPHYAGQVPIVEYKNNDEGIGDFERVLTLIDAYDRLMSDRIDDKDQFIDAILAIYGARLSEDEEELPGVMQTLKEYRILDNMPQEARAEYLKNALDEQGVETLRTALRQDIAKFSMVPELTDESFAGVSSGVAMEYKTLGLKWLGNMKRRMFKKGLDRRLQIMNAYMEPLGRGFDWTGVDVVFDSALPVNREALFPYAQTALSRRTMIANLAGPFNVTDVDEEMNQVSAEEEQSVARQNALFSGGQPFGEGA